MVTGEFGLSDQSSTIEVPIHVTSIWSPDRRRRRISYVGLWKDSCRECGAYRAVACEHVQ